MSNLKDEIKAVLDKKIEFFKDESFDDPKLVKKILAEIPNKSSYDKKFNHMIEEGKKADQKHIVKMMYVTPLLDKEQELHLFKKMNYLKYKLVKRRSDLNSLYLKNKWICEKRLQECISIEKQYIEIRNQIITSNIRLVYNIIGKKIDEFVKKRSMEDAIYSNCFDEMIRSAEKFNWTLGWKFSTYCSNNLYFNYLSEREDCYKHYSRLKYKENINDQIEDDIDHFSDLDIENPRNTVKYLMSELSKYIDNFNKNKHDDQKMRKDMYLKIIQCRFGIGTKECEEMTYQQLADKFQVSKERVRQIQNKAINILQTISQEKILESAVI